MMWTYIGYYTLAMTVLCGAAAALLRMQAIGAKPSIVNFFGGIMLNRGFRLTRRWHLTGDRQLLVATIAAWLIWVIIGATVIAIVSPGYDPGRMYLVYGVLCGLAGGVAGFFLGVLIGMGIAAATRMSSFEGKSGYFIGLMGLLGGFVGALTIGISMTAFFHHQAH